MKNKMAIVLVSIIIAAISTLSFIGCSTMSNTTKSTFNNVPSVAVEGDQSIGVQGSDKPQSEPNTIFNSILVGESNKAYPRKMMWSRDADGKWRVTMIENSPK